MYFVPSRSRGQKINHFHILLAPGPARALPSFIPRPRWKPCGHEALLCALSPTLSSRLAAPPNNVPHCTTPKSTFNHTSNASMPTFVCRARGSTRHANRERERESERQRERERSQSDSSAAYIHVQRKWVKEGGFPVLALVVLRTASFGDFIAIVPWPTN